MRDILTTIGALVVITIFANQPDPDPILIALGVFCLLVPVHCYLTEE